MPGWAKARALRAFSATERPPSAYEQPGERPSSSRSEALRDRADPLLALERGHWFLKHRQKGDKPHRRFVFSRGNTVLWGAREDRSGHLGSLAVDAQTMIVPGCATTTLQKKKLLRGQQSRLLSIVDARRRRF